MPENTKAWLTAPENLNILKSIALNPVFRVFCNYVETSADVSEQGLMVQPVPDTVIVRQAAFAAGLKSFSLKLQGFVRATTPQAEPKPYEYIKAPTPK